MRILWLGRSGGHLRQFLQPHTWKKKLAEKVDLIEHGLGIQQKTIKDLEKDILPLEEEYDPDLIFIANFRFWENLDKRGCPAVTVISDPHGKPPAQRKFINDNKLEATFHRVRGVLPDGKFTYGIEHNYRGKVWDGHHLVFLPFSVPSDVFKDYGFERIYDAAMVWNARGTHPIRGHMVQQYKAGKLDDLKIFYSGRPGRSKGLPLVRHGVKLIIRENYAEVLARSKTMVFGAGKRKYPIMKYTEVMGCNTLVIANTPADAEELHFIPNENFVEINQANYLDKLRYYIAHDEERREIAQRGYETVRKYHTDEIRVNEFLTFVREELM
ncbi:glycosyltransferase family 1 protein [Candidatus Pacearchaeota archaeon]|nr:glycosyltransferase family 1 protein [Candidatus Pacearchaeota archaeon]